MTGTFGAELRDVRESAGFSLGAVEAMSGGKWTSAAVGSWERNERRPPLDRADEYLRDVYGLRVAFVTAVLTEDHLALASRLAGAGMTTAEIDAALAVVLVLRERATLRSVA